MRCYICFNEIIPTITWVNVFKPPEQQRCCTDCMAQFEPVAPTCPKCGRGDSDGICFDCERWGMGQEDPLSKNVASFSYNAFAKDWVAKWKYRGDYELLFSLQGKLDVPVGYAMVPIPLSEERMKERGFNQSEAIIHMLGKQPVSLLGRQGTSKQSKKQRQERVDSENPFLLFDPIDQPVLLVDDIYTTGTTLRHAASLLKEGGCPEVYSYTLFR
ncbi:ComF family protein [Halobacillus salinus]|uniref:ComF family protein n=1 Tax=Halobacillus salinus TaxID=192814 RepID=UPI0009A74E37|nr:ComF family protein [Halobacillus salinus]